MLQTSFPSEIADIITGVVVYFSGLTSLLIILANKYIFKKKNKNQELLLAKANDTTEESVTEKVESVSQIEVNNDSSEAVIKAESEEK